MRRVPAKSPSTFRETFKEEPQRIPLFAYVKRPSEALGSDLNPWKTIWRQSEAQGAPTHGKTTYRELATALRQHFGRDGRSEHPGVCSVA